MRGSAAVISVLFVCIRIAGAQTTSTEVLGTVTDPTGAVVPNAKVTLLRAATGQGREATTTSTGDYSFPLIEIGDYTVTVTMAGFKTQEKTGITVELQQKARVNFTLEVGATSEKVEVVATGVALKTDDAAVAQTIDNRRVVELPLNGRNIAGLAVLTPGVQFGARMSLNGQAPGAFPVPGSVISVSANGQRDSNQQITLDGVTSADPVMNIMMFTPSIDSIEEFKVQTSSYSAEYGMNSGAVVQIALKSGTNQLHGTLFEFLRNDALDAKDYFLNFQLPAGARLQPKNRLRRNQFGVFASGPVVIPHVYNGKDKTFWSFNFEGKRETQESVVEGFFFPQEFRNGDFSALLTPLIRNGVPVRSPTIIFDPTTGEPFRDASGRITNVVPASRINKNAQNFINKYMPLPMFSPADILDVNARASVPNLLLDNQYFFRIDHAFGSRDRIFVRYAGDRTHYTQQNLNPNFPAYRTIGPNNVAFQYIHIVSPQVLNEFRYGLNKNAIDISNPRTNTDFDLDSLGIGQFRVATDNNRKLTSKEAGIPSTIIGGDTSPQFAHTAVHQFTDNVSITRGSHSLKSGFEYRRELQDSYAANSTFGSLSCCPGGYSAAGWLMGYLSGSTTGEGLPHTGPQQNRWGAYFLDDWKATRRLTINAGLRWDFFPAPGDSQGAMRSLRLDILSPAADGRMLPTLIPAPNTVGFKFYRADNRYFMPRVGIAFRATDKWVIRTGAGWFVNAQNLNNSSVLSLLPPRSGTFSFTQVTDVAQVISYEYAGQTYSIQTRKPRPGFPVLTMDNAFPGQGTAPARTNLTEFPPDNRYASVVQWSFDIQRALPANVFLTIGYVGSKSSHLDTSVSNYNSPDPSPNTDIDSRRPYQAFVSQGESTAARGLGAIRYLDFTGNGSYEGLQTSVEKRYSHGVTMGLAYTFSKALGEGYERNYTAGALSGTYQNPRDRRSDRSRYAFDVTHNAVINYVYEMPFLNRFKGPAKIFLGGWQTNGVVSLRSGMPFNVSGGNLNTGGPTRPDRIADGRLGNPTRQLWFDPTAFRRTECNIPAHPELCNYGNAGQGILTGPPLHNFDLSVFKNFKISKLGEAGRLQFRSEFFNAFNTPQFGNPNGIGWATLDSIIPDSSRMGEIRSLSNSMRIMQFALKLYF